MNRTVSLRVLFAVFLMLSFTWTVNASDEASGSLRKCKGEVIIERNGTVVTALEGAPVYSRDTVRTGSDGSVGIIFKDHSRISLGPNSRLELKEFVFKPALRQFSMVNRLAKGVASFVSGKMTKLSPEAVVLETPQSVIGVRGTTYNIKVD